MAVGSMRVIDLDLLSTSKTHGLAQLEVPHENVRNGYCRLHGGGCVRCSHTMSMAWDLCAQPFPQDLS
jgi:hypothetical protein